MTEAYVGPLSPEGLTQEQERLASLLFTTKTEAKVNKRRTLSGDSFEFYSVVRPTAPVDFAKDNEEFVLKLHEKNPGAPLSPYYVNLRNLPEELNKQIAVVLREMDPGLDVDFCTGIPQAGVALGKAYSELTGLNYFSIFEKEVTEGGRKIVPADFGDLAGLRAFVVDDLVTAAGTKEESGKAAKEMGIRPIFRVVVDRQQGGLEGLRAAGYDIKAAFSWQQLESFGFRNGYITEEQLKRAQEYRLQTQK